MATREQLIEDFADHKYATGEKFERLINSMKVVQEPVADPAASGTSLSFIDSIEQDKDGKITATKKTLDLANAHELNPFKGWWKTGDTLPTSGFDGAYLYFKDTTQTPAVTTIYRWNGTTYAPTGTVVDESNVQTFATGQAVNEVYVLNNIQDSVPSDKKIIAVQELMNLLEGSLGYSTINLSDYESVNAYIKSKDGTFVFLYGVQSKFIRIEGGSIVDIECPSGYTGIVSFLSEYNGNPQTGENAHVCQEFVLKTNGNYTAALGASTRYGSFRRIFIAPNDAKYLYVFCNTSDYNLSYNYIRIIKSPNVSPVKKVFGISGGTLSNITGLYPTYIEFYLGYYHTPKYIKVRGSVTIKTRGCHGYVLYYDKNQTYKGYASFDTTDGEFLTEVKFDLANDDYYYIRLGFNTSNNAALPNLNTGIELEGDILGESYQKYPYYGDNDVKNGYQGLTFFVNVKKCNNLVQTEVSSIEQQYTVSTDSGVLHLPSSYKEYGKPTPLIIYLHGAADRYAVGATAFANNNPYSPEWDAAGYAQLDIDLIPDLYNYNGVNSGGSGDDYDCILGAYNWCIQHFNIARDGVYLFGRSRGGQAVLSTLARFKSTEIPIICAVSNAGANSIINYELYNRASSAAQWNLFCNACGLSSLNPPAYTSGSAPFVTQQDIAEFLMSTIDIWWDKAVTALPLIINNPTIYQTKEDIFGLIVSSYNNTSSYGVDFCNFIKQCSFRNDVPLRFDWCVGDTIQDNWNVENGTPKYAAATVYAFLHSYGSHAIYRQWGHAPTNKPEGVNITEPHWHELINFYDGSVKLGNGVVVENPSMARLEWLLWAQSKDRRCCGLQNVVFMPNE